MVNNQDTAAIKHQITFIKKFVLQTMNRTTQLILLQPATQG